MPKKTLFTARSVIQIHKNIDQWVKELLNIHKLLPANMPPSIQELSLLTSNIILLTGQTRRAAELCLSCIGAFERHFYKHKDPLPLALFLMQLLRIKRFRRSYSEGFSLILRLHQGLQNNKLFTLDGDLAIEPFVSHRITQIIDLLLYEELMFYLASSRYREMLHFCEEWKEHRSSSFWEAKILSLIHLECFDEAAKTCAIAHLHCPANLKPVFILRLMECMSAQKDMRAARSILSHLICLTLSHPTLGNPYFLSYLAYANQKISKDENITLKLYSIAYEQFSQSREELYFGHLLADFYSLNLNFVDTHKLRSMAKLTDYKSLRKKFKKLHLPTKDDSSWPCDLDTLEELVYEKLDGLR